MLLCLVVAGYAKSYVVVDAVDFSFSSSMTTSLLFLFFFFQAEDGIRDFCLSRGLGDVYKRQTMRMAWNSGLNWKKENSHDAAKNFFCCYISFKMLT